MFSLNVGLDPGFGEIWCRGNFTTVVTTNGEMRGFCLNFSHKKGINRLILHMACEVNLNVIRNKSKFESRK